MDKMHFCGEGAASAVMLAGVVKVELQEVMGAIAQMQDASAGRAVHQDRSPRVAGRQGRGLVIQPQIHGPKLFLGGQVDRGLALTEATGRKGRIQLAPVVGAGGAVIAPTGGGPNGAIAQSRPTAKGPAQREGSLPQPLTTFHGLLLTSEWPDF
jgi:hypothetical protein